MKLKKLLMVSAMVLTGSFMSAVEAAPDQINIAYVKDPFNLQNIVMKQHQSLEKEFQKDGIKINWVSINSGAQQAQAMAAGSLDVSAVMNTASLLMANGAGNKVLVATGVARPTQVFAVVGKAGQQMKIEDLKGKKVAGPKGTVLHQVLVAALKSKGMSINDVEFIQMDPGKAYAALMGKHVDAALLAASLIIKSNQAGAKTVVTADGLVNPLLVMAVSEKFAKENSAAKKHNSSMKWRKAFRKIIGTFEKFRISLDKRLLWKNPKQTLEVEFFLLSVALLFLGFDPAFVLATALFGQGFVERWNPFGFGSLWEIITNLFSFNK